MNFKNILTSILTPISNAWQNVNSIPSFALFIGRTFTYLVSLGYLAFPRAKEAQVDLTIGHTSFAKRATTQQKTSIEIPGATCQEFIQSYLLLTPRLNKNATSLRIDSYDNLKQMDSLSPACQRLMKMDILKEIPDTTISGRVNLLLHFINDCSLTFTDHFGFMQYNHEVEQKFNQIKAISAMSLNAEDTFTQELDQLISTYKNENKYLTNVKKLPNRMKDIQSMYQKPDCMINLNRKDSKAISKQSSTRAADVKKRNQLGGRIPLSPKSLLECARIPGAMLSKKISIPLSNYNKDMWNSCSNHEIYPSMFMAYLYFELLLDVANTTLINDYPACEVNIFLTNIAAHQSHVTSTLVQCLNLLYPYANKVAQQFGLNLAADKQLQNLWKNNGFLSQFTQAIEEYEKPQTLQKKTKHLNTNIEPIHSFDTPISLKTKKTKDDSQDKKSTDNSNTITLKTSKKERNRQFVIEDKANQEKKANAKLEKQIEKIKNVYHLPPRSFVTDSIVTALTGDHKLHFNMLFCNTPNDRQLTNANIKTLANKIKDILVKGGFQCAESFLRQVENREHNRHTDGNQLPEAWVNLRRPSFIIFGIFPEGWKPKTTEDFDAMKKYLSRLDANRFLAIREKIIIPNNLLSQGLETNTNNCNKKQ